MKLNQENNNTFSVLEYNDTFLLTADKKLKYPCFVGQNLRFSGGDIESMLQKIEPNVELLIVGSKSNFAMQKQVAIKKIINSEFMNIGAAIRTFNLLLDDNRLVVLIII